MKKIYLIIIFFLGFISILWSQTPNLLDDVSQSVRVTVLVRKKARLEVLQALNKIEVRTEDLVRGYVIVPRAIIFKLWCNSLDGALVFADVKTPVTSSRGKILPLSNIALKRHDLKDYIHLQESHALVYESFQKEGGGFLCYDLKINLPTKSEEGIYFINLELSAEPK